MTTAQTFRRGAPRSSSSSRAAAGTAGDERARIIELESVYKIYQIGTVEVVAVRDVSLSVREGEFIAVTGASGSGKSTLVNMIGCLDLPTRGTYRFEGENVSKLSANKLADIRSHKIGFVFQTYSLLPRTSAIGNVELPMMYGRWPERRAKAEHALEMVGLKDRMRHKPTELSGGEQQRVGIARALVTDPSLLIADEPTGNLDSRNTAEILDIISGFNEDHGITIIVVTHEDDVAAVTKRVISMHDGEIATDVLQVPGVFDVEDDAEDTEADAEEPAAAEAEAETPPESSEEPADGRLTGVTAPVSEGPPAAAVVVEPEPMPVSAEEEPVAETPVDEVPADDGSMGESAPVPEGPPAAAVAVEPEPEPMSAEGEPVAEMPVAEVPADEVPAEDETPSDSETMSAEGEPADETPVAEVPADEAPAEDETPSESEAMSAEGEPAVEVPVAEVPAEDETPSESEAMSEEEEPPAEMPVAEMPAADVPAVVELPVEPVPVPAELEPEHEPEPDAEAEAGPAPDPEAASAPEPAPEADAEPVSEPEPEPEPATEAEPEPAPEPEIAPTPPPNDAGTATAPASDDGDAEVPRRGLFGLFGGGRTAEQRRADREARRRAREQRRRDRRGGSD